MGLLTDFFSMTPFEQAVEFLLLILAFSLLLCIYRLAAGPDVPNRTVAFDLIAVHAVGIFALFAVRSDSPLLLEGAIITAVLGFLGTVMFARYMEDAGTNEVEEQKSVPTPDAALTEAALKESAAK